MRAHLARGLCDVFPVPEPTLKSRFFLLNASAQASCVQFRLRSLTSNANIRLHDRFMSRIFIYSSVHLSKVTGGLESPSEHVQVLWESFTVLKVFNVRTDSEWGKFIAGWVFFQSGEEISNTLDVRWKEDFLYSIGYRFAWKSWKQLKPIEQYRWAKRARLKPKDVSSVLLGFSDAGGTLLEKALILVLIL